MDRVGPELCIRLSNIDHISGPFGTQVTIAGTGFTSATKVTFGGVKAASYTVNSETQITASVPTGAQRRERLLSRQREEVRAANRRSRSHPESAPVAPEY